MIKVDGDAVDLDARRRRFKGRIDQHGVEAAVVPAHDGAQMVGKFVDFADARLGWADLGNDRIGNRRRRVVYDDRINDGFVEQPAGQQLEFELHIASIVGRINWRFGQFGVGRRPGAPVAVVGAHLAGVGRVQRAIELVAGHFFVFAGNAGLAEVERIVLDDAGLGAKENGSE